MNIDDLLRAVVERGASDLHLKAGTPAVLRINGKLVRYDDGNPFKPSLVIDACSKLFTEKGCRF